jgi:hypothetical protein
MIAPAYTILETLTRVAPFGIGLWDASTGRLVSDGIVVRVFRLAGPHAIDPVPAVANRSGIFVPHDLFGADAFVEGARATALSPPERFLVDVRDTLERYTSFVMRVGERGPRGFVLPPCVADLELPSSAPSSPPPPPTYVPLFSTASRVVPAGMAAVRASLVDAATGRGAAFAVLEVRESGHLLARAVADARGEVAASFAYPEVSAPPPWSPPRTAPKPLRLTEQHWTLDIAVRYRRNLRRFTFDPSQPPLPDLCDVVQQPLATVAAMSPPAALGEVVLRYGQDLVLGADPDAEPGAPTRAELLISPA